MSVPVDQRSYYLSIVFLTVAAILWGLSFTVVLWTLESFKTSQLLFWRFVFAFVIGEFLFFIFRPKEIVSSFSDAKIAIVPGIALGISLITQTYGLLYTSVTNSSFITSMYVILIPLIAFILYRQRLKMRHLLFALLGFCGMGLILNVKVHSLHEFVFNKGDLITLFSAISAAVQILVIGQISAKIKNSFRFNTYQSFWTLATVIPFLIYEMNLKDIPIYPENPSMLSVWSLITLVIGVSVIAFSLQVLAQKNLSATTASMLCLLEAPFAFFFAALWVHEKLTLTQSFGAIIILASSFLTVYFDRPSEKMNS